jgi:NAD kinase
MIDEDKKMKLNNVLITIKQTGLENLRENCDDLSEVISAEDMKKEIDRHNAHYESLTKIKKILQSHKINYQQIYIPYAAYQEFTERDLVISVGGDGTALSTASYILDETPMLTVKSDIKSHGAICIIDSNEFENELEKILKNDFEIEKWTRLEGKIGKKTVLGLNDVIIGKKYLPLEGRYELSFNGKNESQRATGLLVSTGTGSTAYYKNVRGSDGPFPRTAKELKFISICYDVDANYEMTKGTIDETNLLEIKSLMNRDGIISFDGDITKRMYNLVRGQKIQIKVSDKPLNVII